MKKKKRTSQPTAQRPGCRVLTLEEKNQGFQSGQKGLNQEKAGPQEKKWFENSDKKGGGRRRVQASPHGESFLSNMAPKEESGTGKRVK